MMPLPSRSRIATSAIAACAIASACVPSRSAVIGPVDRELERRLGVGATWSTTADARVPAAVAALLERPLDRTAAIRIALATNRRLQAQYDQLGIAAAAIAEATVLAPTEVQLAYRWGLDGTRRQLDLDVIQDVLGLVLLAQRRDVARSELAAARARAIGATVALAASVELAFIDLVAAQQDRELRETALEAASAATELAERMLAAGTVGGLAVTRERARREQRRIELTRAQLEIEVRREGMNEVLGLSGDETRWTVGERLPELPEQPPALDALERDAVAASLELAAASSDARAAAGHLGLARAQAWLPALGAGVSVKRREGAWDLGPTVSLGLPLFNQQQAARARARAELHRAQHLGAATAIELRARARSIRQRVLATYTEAHQLRAVLLPLRQQIVEETLKGYNAMNASTFELLGVRGELVDADRQYVDALRRYWRADVEARALRRGAQPGAPAPPAGAAASPRDEQLAPRAEPILELP